MNQFPPTNGSGAIEAPLLAPELGMAAAPPQVQAIKAPEPVHYSALDRWALSQFGKPADQLQDEQIDELSEQVRKWAAQDKQLDAGRDARMQADQQSFTLSQQNGPLGTEHLTAAERDAMEVQTFSSPAPYNFCSKLTHMLAGAGIRMHMPSLETSDTQATQTVENFARHYWAEQSDRLALSGGSDPFRLLAHHSVLRGWMTVLQMPKSSDPDLPYLLEIEDPIYVHARFARRNAPTPLRVTRQYTLTALEARAEYPEAEALLEGYKDEDSCEIIGYYDELYHFILLVGKSARGYHDRQLIGRPVRHKMVDFYGNPVNPWLIVKPLGDLSGPQSGGERSSELDGPGALYSVHDILNHIERLTSMMLTQVSKQTDPADILFIREGQQAPEVIKQERGSHNVLFDNQKYQIIDTAANPANFTPLWQYLLSEFQKVTLPAVFYGENAGANSGYQVGLLTSAAMDIIRPYSKGLELMVRMILRRMLEISYHVTPETHGSLPMMAQQGIIRQQIQGTQFDPRIIEKTGVMIDVKLGAITPQDKAATSAWVATMVNSGVISRYTARVESGIDDPLLEFKRMALESLLLDPIIGQMLGPLVATMTDEELYLKGMALKQQLEQQMAMARATPRQPRVQPGEQARQAGQAQLSNAVLPTDLQQPGTGPSNNPSDADRAANSAAASMMAARGGSPERNYPGR